MSSASLEIELRPYPRVSDTMGKTLSHMFGGLFVYMALIFSFLSLTSRMVLEKERHVAAALRSVGMRDSAYWVRVCAASMPCQTEELTYAYGPIFRSRTSQAREYPPSSSLWSYTLLAVSPKSPSLPEMRKVSA